MREKHKKILCFLLTFILMFTMFVPAFAEEDDTTANNGTEITSPDDGNDMTPSGEDDTTDMDGENETSPVIQSIDINANYYAGENNSYTIIFTVMDELPAFTQLTMKIKYENSSVSQAKFDEGVLDGGVTDIMRGSDYAIFPLTYTEAKGISEKTTLCALIATADSVPSIENLSILDFSVIKGGETESTPFTANITVAAGPIIPTLNEETQAIYDTLCSLPNPATLSYYQEDGSIVNLPALLKKTEAAKEAYDKLPSALRADLDAVMTYYNKTNYATGNLASMIKAMIDAQGLIEIAKTAESITEENALFYQFLVNVFEQKKNISLESIIPDSTARNEINQVISAMQTASTLVDTAKESANAETDGGYEKKTSACQSQLRTIQELGGHKYHTDYLADLESQITALKQDIETAYSSSSIMKKALLDTLADVEANILLVKEGVKDMPTVKVDGINQGQIFRVIFTRKSTLPEVMKIKASFVVTDKNGNEIDTAEQVFPANALSLELAKTASTDKYIKDEYYTITAYYHVNDGKFLLDTQTVKCEYIRKDPVPGIGTNIIGGGGLGGPGGGGGSVKPSTPTPTPTPSGGGTIFPESNDDPEPTPPEEDPTPTTSSQFNDIDNYPWAAEAIDTLYSAGIINGMEEGVFNPAGQVTREQFCKMVVALFDLPLASADTSFVDVDHTAWYAPYITTAMQAGYIQGQSDEYFGVGESIMRQDISVILYRALGDQNSKSILNFSDKEDIAPYAEDAIAELVGLGIINGYEDGSLKPRGTATRAEAAKIIYGIYQHLNK